MLTNQDLQQIAQKGITPEQIDVQLKEFETGFPFLRLEAAASIGHGIVAPWRPMKKSGNSILTRGTPTRLRDARL